MQAILTSRAGINRIMQAGILALLMVIAPLATSAERLRGTLSFGAESMTFTACGKPGALWLNATSFKAEGWPAVQKALDAQPRCDLGTTPCGPQKVGIAGTGKISRKGSYGHLGLYAREVRFTRVQVVTTDGTDACLKP